MSCFEATNLLAVFKGQQQEKQTTTVHKFIVAKVHSDKSAFEENANGAGNVSGALRMSRMITYCDIRLLYV